MFKFGDKLVLKEEKRNEFVIGGYEKTGFRGGITGSMLDYVGANKDKAVTFVKYDSDGFMEIKEDLGDWGWDESWFELKYKKEGEDKMKIRVKYLDGAKRMQKIVKGNWIDVYAYEDKFVPEGERAMINLGFALDMPEGFEGHLAPRSSTFKTWGVIQTNSVGR